MAAIKDFAVSNNLQITERDRKSGRSFMDFDFLFLPEMIKAVPALEKRLWLFTSEDDVVDCSASERSSGNVLIGFEVQYDRFTTWVEKEIDLTTFETWLINSNLVETENGRLVREVEIGRGWGNEPDYQTINYSVSEWLDEFQYDERTLTKLFPFFVLQLEG